MAVRPAAHPTWHAFNKCVCFLFTQVFNVAGYYGAEQAVLSLYALGRLGGTVVDIGYTKTGARLAGVIMQHLLEACRLA